MPVGFLTADDVRAVRLAVSLAAGKSDCDCIGCPVCGQHSLNYHVDRNGKQWVSCLMPNCVSWVDDPSPDGNSNDTLNAKPTEPRFRFQQARRKAKPGE